MACRSCWRPDVIIDATVDSFADLVREGNVLVDFWGHNCAPCVAMMPAVDELSRAYENKLRLVKVNSGDKANRPIAWQLKVMGLPTYISLKDGSEVERLTGADVTIAQIEAAIQRLVNGGTDGPEGQEGHRAG